MASVIFKWLRRCTFICVFAFLFMSHNAYAVISDEVEFINSGETYMNVNTSGSLSCTSWCRFVENSSSDVSVPINKFQLYIPNGTFYTDAIFRFDVVVGRFDNTKSVHTYINSIVYDNDIASPMVLYDIEYDMFDTNTAVLHIYVKVRNSFTNTDNSRIWARFKANNSSQYSFALMPKETIGIGNWSLWAIRDPAGDTQSIVNAINSHNYSQTLNNINNDINNVNNSINNINNDVEDATQDAADEAAASGDQSAADAENATAGLISVIGGFVNAITTAQPTNCKINGKINNSFNMGELDLCSMPVPSFVQIISSLILIAICIPFAIVMFNRFIGLFRSFQG